MMQIHIKVNQNILKQRVVAYDTLSGLVRRTAVAIERDATRSIRLTTTRYNAYERPQGKVHYSSQPGEPPNNDSGVLAGYNFAHPTGRFSWEITNDADYALALELGTSRVEARPFMGPAVMENADAFQRACRKVVTGRG
jgi:hypothetical protein